jgi:hypothetical protein
MRCRRIRVGAAKMRDRQKAVICGGKLGLPKCKPQNCRLIATRRGIVFARRALVPFFERKEGSAKVARSDNPADAVREYGTLWGTKAKPPATHLAGRLCCLSRHIGRSTAAQKSRTAQPLSRKRRFVPEITGSGRKSRLTPLENGGGYESFDL